MRDGLLVGGRPVARGGSGWRTRGDPTLWSLLVPCIVSLVNCVLPC